jgi:hypothetical protein
VQFHQELIRLELPPVEDVAHVLVVHHEQIGRRQNELLILSLTGRAGTGYSA